MFSGNVSVVAVGIDHIPERVKQEECVEPESETLKQGVASVIQSIAADKEREKVSKASSVSISPEPLSSQLHEGDCQNKIPFGITFGLKFFSNKLCYICRFMLRLCLCLCLYLCGNET